MRLTSDFWIAALIRRVRGEGGFAYLARRGSPEAGAIFIRISDRLGLSDLYAPAPQALYDGGGEDRRFAAVLRGAEAEAVEARMARETGFDPDLWLVELEDVDDPSRFFTIAEA